MAIAAGAVVPLDEKRRRQHDLLARLREVDHWRRLVAARLDLAVAAVTGFDSATEPSDPTCEGLLPSDLREILGLPPCEAALTEASILLRLRAVLRDLDDYAGALRESTDLATLDLACSMDAERLVRRAVRPAGYARVRTAPRLHLVAREVPRDIRREAPHQVAREVSGDGETASDRDLGRR